jgi:hypothetical protein
MPRSNGRRRFALVTVEVFFSASQAHEHLSGGWWWRPCAPGGLPAYKPVGPFKNAPEAVKDALDVTERAIG